MKKFKSIFVLFLYGIFFLAGVGLLFLVNLGVVSFGKPYASKLAADFQPNLGRVAFINVNVIPMDQEQILANQTVLIEDGIIVQVRGASEFEIPVDTLIVEGGGKYLVPGLTDMHVHVKEENELLLFATNGVTAVRNMWGGEGALRMMGFPDHLAWKRQIENGDLFGPTLFTSGPIMEGPPKTMPLMQVYSSPEAAAEAVTAQVAQGYDFIKVYDYLDLSAYQAVIKTAKDLNTDVTGHVPKQVGLEQALASGQKTIEHLSGFIDSDTGEYLLPEDELAFYAAKTAQAGAWVCPTIAVYQMHVPNEDLHVLEERPEMAYISPGMKLTWQYFSRPGAMGGITYQGDYPSHIREMFISTTRILHENGVAFILGTDSDNPYLVPGFSLLDELDYLIAAGFTPYEALETGTRNPAEALGKIEEFGTVEVGKRADLILLNENPISDISNIRNRAGVVLRGQWFPETMLQNRLQELENSYSPNILDRISPLGLIVISIFMFSKSQSRKGMKDE